MPIGPSKIVRKIASDNIAIHIPSNTLSGRVLGATDGDLVSVHVTGSEDQRLARVTADGSFMFRGLPTGSCRLRVSGARVAAMTVKHMGGHQTINVTTVAPAMVEVVHVDTGDQHEGWLQVAEADWHNVARSIPITKEPIQLCLPPGHYHIWLRGTKESRAIRFTAIGGATQRVAMKPQ
ncbi:MAG: hypothetical protein ACI9S9_001504 [Planctomycetota bacterium]